MIAKSEACPRGIPQAIRWGALVWLALWVPAYWRVWGAVNFLQLCDLAVLLTCAGLWTRNRLLLSSQAVATPVVSLIWTLDAAFLIFVNRPFFGGVQFLRATHIPLWVRLLSFHHVLVPVVLLWALSRIGYDRRAWVLQCGITLAALLIGRFTNPFDNIDFAFRDPFWGRQLGPLPLHITISIVFAAVVLYAPAHLILLLLYRKTPRGLVHSSLPREQTVAGGHTSLESPVRAPESADGRTLSATGLRSQFQSPAVNRR